MYKRQLNDPIYRERIGEYPILQYICAYYDQIDDMGEIPRDPDDTCLVYRLPIRHSVMHVVDTEGFYYSRSTSGDCYVKVASGGGQDDKSLANLHFAARNGVFDEFGIGFHNPAVLRVSPPILCVDEAHPSEQRRRESVSYVYVQIMLIDASQVVWEGDPVTEGDPTGDFSPTTPGNWGKYRVGGEMMRCREVERGNSPTRMNVSFCREPLEEIKYDLSLIHI